MSIRVLKLQHVYKKHIFKGTLLQKFEKKETKTEFKLGMNINLMIIKC